MTAPDLIARHWLGTPYLHQASTRGAGCDCLGLIVGVWRDMGGVAPELPPYSRDWSEPQGEERLWDAAAAVLEPASGALAAGQILLFRMRAGAVAKHLGIVSAVSGAPRFIHAMAGRGVIDSPLSHPWQRRIVARFAYPTFDLKGA